MSAPIPADLRELYDAASTVKEAMPGLWIPHAGPRVVELIERIAVLEAQVRHLQETLTTPLTYDECSQHGSYSGVLSILEVNRILASRAALAATEPKEKA